MSTPHSEGRPGASGARGAGGAKRLLLPAVFLLLIAGVDGVQWWQESADRAADRLQLMADTREELGKEKPDRDRLGELMARLTQLPDAATAPDLLAAQAEIELLRGRPERAERLFGALAASPGATAAQQRLGARILIARQDSFGGDAASMQSMLQQVVTFSERAYADGGDARDAFRSWQGCKRLWDHAGAQRFAQQLAGDHAESKEHRLVALAANFDPSRDASALDDLLVDFDDPPPAELAALRTFGTLNRGDVPGALRQAEKDLNRCGGVGGVRYVLAIVLHACTLGSPEGSLDRAEFARRRDAQLTWLEERAPAGEALRQQWRQMRALR